MNGFGAPEFMARYTINKAFNFIHGHEVFKPFTTPVNCGLIDLLLSGYTNSTNVHVDIEFSLCTTLPIGLWVLIYAHVRTS